MERHQLEELAESLDLDPDLLDKSMRKAVEERDNRYERRDGHHYHLGGEFVWWPCGTRRGKPWPKEVPVLGPENFVLEWGNPDTRRIGDWIEGFPCDFSKNDKILTAIKQAAKEFSLRGFGGSYGLWKWGDKQAPEDLARVWNRAMEILGYTERV